ncbi:SDR family NAD(P)-dependent oxidoreductase [Rossellomorea sp. NPDC077527]|uniref:SDR family NAD(P)-dependent oxidoreductase n=1 Tax=Rossellomorea sp. NPDC077527 TaxID=3364510 RepID=UPI0037C8BD4B
MKYTVITGASSGIGYETALAFAKEGKNLIITARRQAELEKLKKEVQEIDSTLDVVINVTDLSILENVYSFYESLKDYELETFVNNAGFGNFDPVGSQRLEKIEKLLQLNVEALTILSSLFVRDYAEKEGTQIINISSVGGYTIFPDAVTYCSSKYYVSAFTEGLSQELKTLNAKMQAKVLAPASTQTEFSKRAREVNEYVYKGDFHTAKEMASFLLELYHSDKTVGIVDLSSYEFELRDPIFNHL